LAKKISRKPPPGAPEGTVWFGGPVDRWKVSLRVFGHDLNPDEVSAQLGCEPSSAQRRGDPYPRKGGRILTIDSRNCDENVDVDDGIKMLLARLPLDSAAWVALTSRYKADIHCGLFLEASNRGFEISSDVYRLLLDRNLEVGFDVYFDPPKPVADWEAPCPRDDERA
jgi:hypothetical protein